MKKIINYLKKYGIYGCFIKFFKVIFYKFYAFFEKKDRKNLKRLEHKRYLKNKPKYDYLESLIKDEKYKYVFVFYPYTEWNLPIFQRPQQIALELTKRSDVLYFFCTANYEYDKIEDIYEKINDNLYVLTDFDFLTEVETDKRIIHLYSTDTVSKYDIVEEALERNDKVVYEYIDEIHEEITQSLPEHYLQKHHKVLKNEECYIVTTADKLYDDVKQVRTKRFTLSTNGVNIDDFKKQSSDEIPEDLLPLKEKYVKLICYYGALAKWFDYELIRKISKKYPNYGIILIGIEYDDAFKKSEIEKLSNVHYLGKKNYYDLHKYSTNVDLLTIPFLINEITESTSPVKLFEYMAANTPILTTNMKECRKYKSVEIATNHEEYLKKINKTIELKNDKKYIETETKEAKENTWKKKAELILELLDK